MELLTERLRLRAVSASDRDALHDLWTEPDVRRYLWDDVIIDPGQVDEVIAASEGSFAAAGFGQFALELRGSEEGLIGFCGLRTFEGGDQVELLYGIAPRWWRKGIVHEAAVAVLRHAFEELNLRRVIAATDTPNQRSVQVMQRLGMSFDERREFHGLDTVFYSITAEEFSEFHDED